jgi:hypothetical protein
VNASTQTRRRRPRPPSAVELDSRLLFAGLATFAAVELGLAIFMAFAPHVFYTSIGPFGASNEHYLRDVSTFYAALGAGAAISIRRPSWRIPVLAITTVQFGLHSVNHLVDIGKADPGWIGYFDFFSLAAATLQLAWLLRLAARTSPITPKGDQP